MDSFLITREYLDDAIENSGKSLVGRILRRLEEETDEEVLKRAVKNLVYEALRDLKVNIRSFNYGVKFTSGKR